jgi:hypothetical protein
MKAKTHTITGTRKGKEFTKVVEIQYDSEGLPRWIYKLFGSTGYIDYEESFDDSIKDEYGQPLYIGTAETPNTDVYTYRNKLIIENFKIIN